MMMTTLNNHIRAMMMMMMNKNTKIYKVAKTVCVCLCVITLISHGLPAMLYMRSSISIFVILFLLLKLY
jgi:hypothetical protein